MPNSAHLHLLLNHFPVIGMAIVALFFLNGFLRKSDDIKHFSLWMIFLISIITIGVFITGNNAEGIVKGMEGVIEENIDPHQQFATYSFIAMEITGAFALAGLLLFRKPKTIPMIYSLIILLFIAIVLGMMIYTSNLGGKITHFELMEKGKSSLLSSFSENIT